MSKVKESTKKKIYKRETLRRAKFAAIRAEIQSAFEKYFENRDELSDAKYKREAKRILRLAERVKRKVKSA